MKTRFLGLEAIVRRDRSQLNTVVGLRTAIAVVICLVIGVLAGNLSDGLGAAIGAQVSGFAVLSGTARRRIRTLTFAGFWMAVSTWVGGVTADTALHVVLITLLSFLAGLLTCVSPEAGMIGTWSIIAILFMPAGHLTAGQALERSLFMLCGALVQMILLIAVEWLRTSNAERAGVSAALRAIAQYARTPSRGADLKVASTLLDAGARLSDSFMVQSRWETLRTLLDFAESIRIEVVALVGMERAVRDAEAPEDGRLLRDVAAAREAVAHLLTAAADRLAREPRTMLFNRTARAHPEGQAAAQQFRTLEAAAGRLEAGGWKHASTCVRHACEELHRMMERVQSDRRTLGQRFLEQRLRLSPPPLRTAWETLRTNFTFRSSAFRHAVRLAAAMCIAVLLESVSPLQRSYWLPLTVLVILKPEFSTTFIRGVGRSVGTLIGAVVATGLIAIPDETHTLGIVLMGLLLWGMYAFLNYNLVVFSTFLTAEVVVLLSFFQHLAPLAMLVNRVVYTIAGSLLAFLAYIVWPTWQRRNVPAAIARVIRQEQLYLRSVWLRTDDAGQLADRGGREDRSKHDPAFYRKQTRLARTNAVSLVNQAVNEPGKQSWDAASVEGMLTALHRLSDAILWVESYTRNAPRDVLADPRVQQFLTYVDRCLSELALAVEHQAAGEAAHPDAANGVLDSVRTYTKQEIRGMDIPPDLIPIFLRMEDAIGTLFRMTATLTAPTAEPAAAGS
ncbi:FUSC family protein [Alicyclobacillus cycloheptanicus]|uniref:Membrane protein YccC n=1 Tax=Alicyclobacillus cycloheptanicus TaxID=1457 RepID=A0ABT9XHG9_9BACL|nr:FUSC family protein [Alicyclobacillus cycloheptanicus]MDQ0189758.1 putative membrane protein YccC [Alicyclobacillus cycloheptanicus]WDM01962.1 FUSC family protein [Alicyclobacillus cycloheptanicus]